MLYQKAERNDAENIDKVHTAKNHFLIKKKIS
jgi:hypothetical protein